MNCTAPWHCLCRVIDEIYEDLLDVDFVDLDMGRFLGPLHADTYIFEACEMMFHKKNCVIDDFSHFNPFLFRSVHP